MNDLKKVRGYWDSHHLGTQFINGNSSEVGSREYFQEFDEAMERWEYKNQLIGWITERYPKGKILEVGCGLGQDLVKFAKQGFSVTGIDLASSVATMAARHLEAYKLKGRVLQGNAENLIFSDNEFDVVYSCGVLQHTPEIQRAVDEIHRVLHEDGLAVVIVYYRYSLFNLLSTIGGVKIEFEDEDAPIINTYSKRELFQIFSKFNSTTIDLEYSYPTQTPRKGFKPYLYNNILIPVVRCIPNSIMRHFGWHAVVKAWK